MCTLEIVRQVYVHVKVGNGVLLAIASVFHAYRVTDIFDTHLINGDLPGVLAVLNVSDITGGSHFLNPRVQLCAI